ncbi:MAG: hypothetical protein KBS74_07570 [Clostridiales bacterium]|nr:hypothetical protein [Candidatus Cacconaster stercorequi]
MTSIKQRLDRLEVLRDDGEIVTVIDFSTWPDEPTVYKRPRRADEPRKGISVDFDGLEGD